MKYHDYFTNSSSRNKMWLSREEDTNCNYDFFNVVSRRKMSKIILRTIRNENSNKEQDDQCNLHDEHTTKNS